MAEDYSNDIFSDIDIDSNCFSNLYPDLFSDDQSRNYDVDSFNQISVDTSADFTAVHVNIRSMAANFE